MLNFLGLATHGNTKISPDKDLVAFWRTMYEQRFQNYEAVCTVLETVEPINRNWLEALIYHHDESIQFAPMAWRKFIAKCRKGIIPFISKRLSKVPTKYD